MIMSVVDKLIKSLESYNDMIASLMKLNKVTGLLEEPNGEIILEGQSSGLEVSFKDVSLNFGDSRPIFTDHNFYVPPNSLAVRSGKAGAGKVKRSLLQSI
jgi:ATP-binding cassette subfamily B protein